MHIFPAGPEIVRVSSYHQMMWNEISLQSPCSLYISIVWWKTQISAKVVMWACISIYMFYISALHNKKNVKDAINVFFKSLINIILQYIRAFGTSISLNIYIFSAGLIGTMGSEGTRAALLHWLQSFFAVLLLAGYTDLLLGKRHRSFSAGCQCRCVHRDGTGRRRRVHLAVEGGRDAEID